MANGDPLLLGTDPLYPNVNCSSAPTTWDEDLVRAAGDGLPSGPGPMLTLNKLSTDETFLPGGEINPAAEDFPSCVEVRNIRFRQGNAVLLTEARIGLYNVGGGFTGGSPGIPGTGVVGLGPRGNGVIGVAQASTGGLGVAGFTNSSQRSDAGVYGRADRGGVGVLGESFLGSGVAVEGTGNRVGVRGVGRLTGGRSGIGVEGVPGPFDGTSFPWAGAFRGSVRVDRHCSIGGDLFVSGTKSAVLRHPDGSDRATYAVESPESWLEDFGRAEVVDGRAVVELDPDFVAVARLGDDYHVFLSPEGETEGLFVGERTPTGFEVRELRGGRGTLRFSFRIVTRRPDVEGRRLAPVELLPEGEAPAEPSRSTGPPAAARTAETLDAGPPPGWPSVLLSWPPDTNGGPSD